MDKKEKRLKKDEKGGAEGYGRGEILCGSVESLMVADHDLLGL